MICIKAERQQIGPVQGTPASTSRGIPLLISVRLLEETRSQGYVRQGYFLFMDCLKTACMALL